MDGAVRNTVPGLNRGGAGFAFFGEYFDLIKHTQAMCEDETVAEAELFDVTGQFSDLYARYKEKPQSETGVDRQYLCSLCVAGCDLIDRRLKELRAEKESEVER